MVISGQIWSISLVQDYPKQGPEISVSFVVFFVLISAITNWACHSMVHKVSTVLGSVALYKLY